MSSEKSTVPENWVIAPLLELLESLESGSRPKGGVRGIESGIPSIGGEHLDSEGGFKLSNIRYVPESFADSMTKGKIEIGDVLVVKDGATTGKVSYVSSAFPYKKAVVNEHVFLCRVSNLLPSKYVFYYLFSEQGKQEILEDFRGAAQGGISQRFASLVQIPLAPINEQLRIVEKLEELLSDLDAGVEELKSAQAKLVQYRQSLLKSAVEGTLTAEWRTKNTPKETGEELLQRILKERRKNWEEKQIAKYKEQGKEPPKGWQDKYPEPALPDTKDLPELPNGWVWASLDQLVSESSYGTSVKCSYDSNGIPVLRIPNISSGELDLRDIKFSTINLGLKKDDYLAIGDLLVIRTNGSIGLVGRAASVVSELPISYYFASYLLRLRCIEKTTLHRWLLILLTSKNGRQWLEARAASSAGQHNISLSTLLTMPIALAPIEEQTSALDAIARAQESIKQQENTINLSIKQSNAQRKNVLKSAFTGQLVSQSIDDEPASVLLERVRAQREEQQSLPRKKRVTKKSKESQNMAKTLIEILMESGDWLPAQEAFRRCGISDGATTDEIEVIYSELRQLDQAKKLEVNTVYFDDGRKQFDRIRLLIKD